MATLARESGTIHYTVQGEAEAVPLLMLRGLGRSSRYWLGFDRVMAKHFRVITIDQRGLGRSTQPMNWSDGIETLSDDTLAVLDSLGVDRFHVFGLSFGGMIGTVIAGKEPERILSLTVAASSSADYRSLRLHPLAFPKLLFALRAGRFQDALLKAVVPKMVLREHGDTIQAAWQDIVKEEGFPLLTTLLQLKASLTHTIGDRLDRGRFPVLFLHGSMDTFVPVQNSRHMHRLVERSEYAVVKGAGHEIALGFEREVSQILRDFIDNVA